MFTRWATSITRVKHVYTDSCIYILFKSDGGSDSNELLKKKKLQNTNIRTITMTIFETLKTHIIKFSGCKEAFNNWEIYKI